MLKLACSVACGKQRQFPTIALGRYQDKVVCPFRTRVRRLPLLWHQLCANLPFRFWVEMRNIRAKKQLDERYKIYKFVQKCFRNVLKDNKLKQSDPFPERSPYVAIIALDICLDWTKHGYKNFTESCNIFFPCYFLCIYFLPNITRIHTLQ